MTRCWGCTLALGQLGFDPAEIFVRHSGIVHPVTRLDGAGVVLRTQGKEFTAAVMPCPVDADAFAKAWKQSCERWNGLGQKERDRLYRKHFLSTEASRQLPVAIALTGIIMPAAAMEQESPSAMQH